MAEGFWGKKRMGLLEGGGGVQAPPARTVASMTTGIADARALELAPKDA